MYAIRSYYVWEGEEGESIASANKGDHTDARLPQNQVDFLKKIRMQSNKPLIVVITCGNPLIIPEVYEMADAVIYALYPGEQGGNARITSYNVCYTKLLRTLAPKVFAGSAKGNVSDKKDLVNPFAIKGKWYKAALHVHTTTSDGDVDVATRIKQYRDKGFDIVAITDHRKTNDLVITSYSIHYTKLYEI